MYIKLTRFNNQPVWINAAFVVTVEPRKEGCGAVVVPIGDGFDYDVRESPEEVLRMLEGCPAPQVVPVPVSDCLAKTPADVSPEPERRPADTATDEKKPIVQVGKPTKKPTKMKKPVAAKKPKAAKTPALELSGEDVIRLGKLAPKSVTKLKNTLDTQFHIADVSGAVAALTAKGIIKIDGNHITWTAG